MSVRDQGSLGCALSSGVKLEERSGGSVHGEQDRESAVICDEAVIFCPFNERRTVGIDRWHDWIGCAENVVLMIRGLRPDIFSPFSGFSVISK